MKTCKKLASEKMEEGRLFGKDTRELPGETTISVPQWYVGYNIGMSTCQNTIIYTIPIFILYHL